MTSQTDDHADKYNDPRVRITRTGILIAIAVILFGIGGTALSIWARRTRLEQSTAFWGPQVIQAFQLAAEVKLVADPQQPAAAMFDAETSAVSPEPVRLTGMPGLGHLRHVLLDDRSYLWDSVRTDPISTRFGKSKCMTLWFSDPEAQRFPDAKIVIDLEQGWVGNKDGDRQVQLNERFRNALPTFLQRIADYEPMRVEMRQKKSAGG